MTTEAEIDNVDRIAPVVTITTPGEGTYHNRAVELQAEVEEEHLGTTNSITQ